jgi:hypothetical protein
MREHLAVLSFWFVDLWTPKEEVREGERAME